MLDNHAAAQWPKDRRQSPDAADDALHLGALSIAVEDADDNERQGVDRATAETLNGAEDDHRFHALRRAAQRRADQKNADTDKHQPALAEKVGELAEDRRGQR